jgi:hypothetical protein
MVVAVDHDTEDSKKENEQGGLGVPSAPGYLDASEEWEGRARIEVGVPAEVADAPLEDRTVADDEWQPRPTDAPPLPPTGGAAASASEDLGIRQGRVTIIGLARSVQVRSAENGPDVLSLRVDRYDPNGNRLQPVGVEVFAYRGGLVSEGDEVEVSGRWHDGTLRSRRLVNRTTGAQVKGFPRWAQAAVGIAVLSLFIAWILIIVFVLQ